MAADAGAAPGRWILKTGREKDKVDDEDAAFKRMVAKMQEVAGERAGYLHGRGALDGDDLLYLTEQMEAEEDLEQMRKRTEKRAFAAFRAAATIADSIPMPPVASIRIESKPKSAIRQSTLLKIVEVKPKKPRLMDHPSSQTEGHGGCNHTADQDVQARMSSAATPVEDAGAKLDSSNAGRKGSMSDNSRAGTNAAPGPSDGTCSAAPPVSPVRQDDKVSSTAESQFFGIAANRSQKSTSGNHGKVEERNCVGLLGLAYGDDDDDDDEEQGQAGDGLHKITDDVRRGG